MQRFFCHYPRAILKPGEEKRFTFSFKSCKIGMFNEEFELLTEPLLQNPLSIVSLSGICTKEDVLKPKRQNFWNQYMNEYSGRDASTDKIDDIMKDIKYPAI